jgi:hypothetical protein
VDKGCRVHHTQQSYTSYVWRECESTTTNREQCSMRIPTVSEGRTCPSSDRSTRTCMWSAFRYRSIVGPALLSRFTQIKKPPECRDTRTYGTLRVWENGKCDEMTKQMDVENRFSCKEDSHVSPSRSETRELHIASTRACMIRNGPWSNTRRVSIHVHAHVN